MSASLKIAIAVGWASYGWPGVVLAITVIVFWLLLQFSRALRAMREAGGRPVGQVASAVMLNASLHRGLRLTQVITKTRSLGVKLADEPETFGWTDAAGDSVRVEFTAGRCSAWALQRAEPPADG